MNFSRIPSLALLLVGSSLAFAPMLQAGGSNKNGNPFGNGTFFQTTGTFSAVVRGENLSGTTLFSTGANTNGQTTNSSGGSTTISYLGSPDGASRAGMYFGNASGMWNPSSGAISGQIWGSQRLSGSNSTRIYPQIYDTNNFPVPIQVLVLVTNGITQNVTTATNTIGVMPVGSNTFNDSAMISGNFAGSTQNQYPNQTFTAQGAMVLQQLYPQQQDTSEGTLPFQMAADVNIPITVQGVRVSDSYSTFNTISNSIPYSTTTYTITNFATF